MATAHGMDLALVNGKIVGVGRTNEIKELVADDTNGMDRDILTIPEEEIKHMKVETTMVGGEIVYQTCSLAGRIIKTEASKTQIQAISLSLSSRTAKPCSSSSSVITRGTSIRITLWYTPQLITISPSS
jgi:hypothetical protein